MTKRRIRAKNHSEFQRISQWKPDC